MLQVPKAIRTILLGTYPTQGTEQLVRNPSFEIYDFVGDRVYPEYKMQATEYPAIIYTIDSTEPDKIKGGRSLNNNVKFDLMLLTESYAELVQLTTIVVNHLHRYKNSFNGNDNDSIGYGTPVGSYLNKYGYLPPASTGDIQYMGGLQIQAINFLNSVESFDDKLKIYKNTLSFELTYIDDLTVWGADVILKFTDLNLMATNVNSTDDPLYTQPIALNQGVNYLFLPNVLIDWFETKEQLTINSSALEGRYNQFYDTSGTNNTNRPILKQSAENPPKYNKNNYLEFGLSKYLKANITNYISLRKYSQVTFYCVAELPGSDSASTSSAILFKDSGTTAASGGIVFWTEVIGDIAAGGIIKFNSGGIALQDDLSGGESERGFNFFGGIVKWPLFGLNLDLSMENPFYFAVNFERSNNKLKLSGQYEWIVSSSFTRTVDGTGDINKYEDWSDTASTEFKQYFFNFNTIHSDITNFNTNGIGTLDLNGQVNIYDFVLFPEFQTFGSNKYLQIKKLLIEKHNMWQRTTN